MTAPDPLAGITVDQFASILSTLDVARAISGRSWAVNAVRAIGARP